ncbi:MAG: membrane protein [Patescibacteria group bacterium]|nr:MAG: membrane protein [Patescibacteria group bacterium]
MTKNAKSQLKQYLKPKHCQNPFADYLKEIVYGGVDGIITTFAVVSGFAGASNSNPTHLGVFTLLLFGFANLFADGLSMGVGNFLSVRSEQEIYKKRKLEERSEISKNFEMELSETIGILKQKGFTTEDAEKIAKSYAKNPEFWTEFKVREELELPNVEKEKPFLTALATIISFITFGLIPLLPYVLIQRVEGTFLISVASTIFALFLLGVLRWIITKRNFFLSVFEIVSLGGIAAITAYLVGMLFRNKI